MHSRLLRPSPCCWSAPEPRGHKPASVACRVILLSGQAATVDLLEEARGHGHSFDILAKPTKPEQLIAAISFEL